MANIIKMEMVKSLSAQGKASINKGFLGLGAKVIIDGQPMRALTREYAPAEGAKMQHIIGLPVEAMAEALAAEKPVSSGLGNIRLEALTAADGQLLLIQLFRYSNFKLDALSPVIEVRGPQAETLVELL